MYWLFFLVGFVVAVLALWKGFRMLGWSILSLRKTGSASIGECKLALIIRQDINMSKGKAAAQCCHATLAAYREAMKTCPQMVERWEGCGEPKVTLKIPSEAELLDLQTKARKIGLSTRTIKDAGRTQLISGTRTVLAIGPGPVKLIDYICGHLRLY